MGAVGRRDTLDADDNVIERRVVHYHYPTREEAVDTVESVAMRFAEARYKPLWVIRRHK